MFPAGVKTVIHDILHNILIESLHLIVESPEGEIFESGTKEYFHGIALDGVQNCTIRNCIIDNFHGDGISVAQNHVDDPTPMNMVVLQGILTSTIMNAVI